jgi:anti-sigma B factor antagonist
MLSTLAAQSMSLPFAGLFARRSRSTPPAAVAPLPAPAPASEPKVAFAPPIAREMRFTRTDTAAETRLRIEGTLDLESAPQLRATFDAIVGLQPRVVILELDALVLLDSSGVGAVVSLFKRVSAAGGSVQFKGVQGQPLAVCKLLKLDRVFGLHL